MREKSSQYPSAFRQKCLPGLSALWTASATRRSPGKPEKKQPPSQWFLSPLLGPLYVTSHNFLIKKSFVCIKRPPLSCPPQRGFSEPLAQLYNISIRQRSERPTPHRLHRVASPSSRPSCRSHPCGLATPSIDMKCTCVPEVHNREIFIGFLIDIGG